LYITLLKPTRWQYVEIVKQRWDAHVRREKHLMENLAVQNVLVPMKVNSKLKLRRTQDQALQAQML